MSEEEQVKDPELAGQSLRVLGMSAVDLAALMRTERILSQGKSSASEALLGGADGGAEGVKVAVDGKRGIPVRAFISYSVRQQFSLVWQLSQEIRDNQQPN